MDTNQLHAELSRHFDLLHQEPRGVNPDVFKAFAWASYGSELKRAGDEINLDDLMRDRVLALTAPRD